MTQIQRLKVESGYASVKYQGWRIGRGQTLTCGYPVQVMSCFQAHLLGRGVDVDEDKQQEVEEDADDPQHRQESLLWCAWVWTR